MARFKKEGSGEVPGINTGSMSDIIFMFLFFFMVITTMRETTMIVKVTVPQASEIQKLSRKQVSAIYVGQPNEPKKYGTEPRIQLNDAYADKDAIGEWVTKERENLQEADKMALTIALKIDKEVKMGIVTDIKQELRKAGAFKINYATRKDEKRMKRNS